MTWANASLLLLLLTSHWLPAWASRSLYSPPPPTPHPQALPTPHPQALPTPHPHPHPHPHPPPPTPPRSVLIRRPAPYYPMPSTPHPPPPFNHPRAIQAPPVVPPVDHHFRSSFIAPAYTGPVFHCPPLSSFRLSSVLLTSVGSTFVIPSALHTPPALR